MSDSGALDEKKPRMSSNWGLGRSYPDRYPIDVFSYTREATHCFQQRRFLACIAMASTAVEIILNRDRRLRALANFKSSDGWAYLNNRTLRVARDKGLPSDALLSSGEDLNGQRPIAFVATRNKIAHGDVEHVVSNLSDYDPGAERIADEQALKMRRFVSEWFNTAPDVQEGHIRNNHWPDTV
jgi:hypothetical protein